VKSLCLIGKEYSDTIMFVQQLREGETNDCSAIRQKRGGIYNFFETKMVNWIMSPITIGTKKAFIISDKSRSTRTSIVLNNEESLLTKNQINKINDNFDWLHVSYVDDIECFSKLEHIAIPFSLDFCTDKNRVDYINLMERSSIIFDSRERKHLYSNISTRTPIILHEPDGFEIIVNGEPIHKEKTIKYENLNVNGAGDIYAAHFLDCKPTGDLAECARYAAKSTTDLLLNREE